VSSTPTNVTSTAATVVSVRQIKQTKQNKTNNFPDSGGGRLIVRRVASLSMVNKSLPFLTVYNLYPPNYFSFLP
jgi:hypothetical protein